MKLTQAQRAQYIMLSAEAARHEATLAHRIQPVEEETVKAFAARIGRGRDVALAASQSADFYQAALLQAKGAWPLAFAVAGYRLGKVMMGAKTYVCMGAKALEVDAEFWGEDVLIAQKLKPQVSAWVLETSLIETETTARLLEELYQRVTANEEYDKIGDLASAIETQGLADSTARANLLSRTLTNWAYNNGASQAWHDGGIDAREWITTEDDMTCPWCREMDGAATVYGESYFDAGDGFERTDEDGKKHVMNFRIAIKQPPLHPHCRCTWGPLMPEGDL